MEPSTLSSDLSLNPQNTPKQDAPGPETPQPDADLLEPPFYQAPPGFSPEKQAKAEARILLVKPMAEAFPFFAGLSLLFGILFTFCLYKNPCGVTYPLFAAFACLTGVLTCKKLHVPIKKDSWILLAFAFLTGLSVCRTADKFLIRLDGIALVLSGCIFALHQFYDDRTWNIGKYLSSILLYLCQALGALPFPFRHTRDYLKNQDNPLVKQLPLFFIGFLAALPVLSLVVALLGAADPIFSELTAKVFQGILRPSALLAVLLQTAFAALSLYCLVCACLLKGISGENPDRKKASPVAVIAGLSAIALIYVSFCLIQIVYLFLGRGTLPEGFTYSSYARQGFFQLLAVAFLNLVMVLCCLKYIRPHVAVKILLTILCGCTYIMIASAFCRLVMYVGEYRLTYLRLLALWFLVVLAVLMAGVTWLVLNPGFPLFRYSLAVVLAFYLALSFARPDSLIGWDYVTRLEGDVFSRNDFYYLSRLSADAAPSLAYMVEHNHADNSLPREELENSLEFYYEPKACPYYKNLNLRNYNFSYAKAKKLFPGH